ASTFDQPKLVFDRVAFTFDQPRLLFDQVPSFFDQVGSLSISSNPFSYQVPYFQSAKFSLHSS
ncbi:hypothetical protein, partial [Lysinibacillus sp. UBA6686]